MFRHSAENVPAYRIWLPHKPSLQGKGKANYMAALKQAGASQIAQPIPSNDVEVSLVYSTRLEEGMRADVDNILKPTLDALKGVAYLDDRQVRAVSSRVFTEVRGPVSATEYVSLTLAVPLLKPTSRDLVVISIFSDGRLIDLGGTEVVRKRIAEEERALLRSFHDEQGA